MASVRPQEASSSTPPCTYHVFLSFRGEDTRKNFTDHLYTALYYAGFRTFRDDDEIERGENIKLELQKAIQESRISIVVLSKNYASSSWCLDELVMILDKRRSNPRHVVLPVLYGVDPSEVRKQSGCFQAAFMEHERKFAAEGGERRKEWMSKVDEWRAALKEVADLAGTSLQNQADGHESRFIQKIIDVVGDKLSRTILDITPYVVGIHSRAREIQFWLEDGSADVGVAVICGMGGIGKTTIAKLLYNKNFSRFEGSSFLANVRETSKQQDGILRLQRQLLSEISKGRKEKIYNVDEGIIKIKDALSFKRVLVVLDDVDNLDQLDAVLGMRDWFFSGSKIIITTRREHLLRAHEVCNVHRIQKLNDHESLELFSLYAFGQSQPINDYADMSKLVIQHCGGLPLAIKVLGSSLSRKNLGEWKSQLEKLKAIPENEILEKLKISYDSLQDDHDKSLFLHLACFFVGSDKDFVVTILDECEFYTVIGIRNLIDRCLVKVDGFNKLEMHQLLQDMGKEIVRQESPKEPGERSRVWDHKDSFDILRNNTGTRKIEGLILDISILEQDKSSRRVSGFNRKRSLEEISDNSSLSRAWKSLKRHRFGIFSQNSFGIASSNSNQMVLETDAFEKLHNLKLLQLNYVQIRGSYKKFPKKIRWLCWHGFPFESISSDFLSETLVVLEMPHSSLKIFMDGTKFLETLKILNLSHSHSLAKTNFMVLPHLERLVLEDCTSLVEIHESLGQLERLVLLSLKDCNNLRKLPRSIGMLKSLATLDISGCSNLENLPDEMRNMDSLKVLQAENVTGIFRSPCTFQDAKTWYSFIQPSQLKLRKNPETSWASSLPQSLLKLSLVGCNLTEDAFPTDLSNLYSLEELNLSNNLISTLPNCIGGLDGLQSLHLDRCRRLRSLIVLQELQSVSMQNCILLEKVTFLAPAIRTVSFKYRDVTRLPPELRTLSINPRQGHAFTSEYDELRISRGEFPNCPDYGCKNLVEFSGRFKLEPIGNVDKEIIDNLGLFNLGSMRDLSVMLSIPGLYSSSLQKLSIQGCHERNTFYTYLPGSKVPGWFNLTCIGNSLSFTAPHQNFRIRGLSSCGVYTLSSKDNNRSFYPPPLNIVISNITKRLVWSHAPAVTAGIPEPEAGGDMVWLSYWKFENQVEGGDELNISMFTEEGFQVNEVGAHIVYEVEKAPNITQQIVPTSEVEQAGSEEIYPYGLPLPGNAPPYQEKTQVFSLGYWHHNVADSLLYGRLSIPPGEGKNGLP